MTNEGNIKLKMDKNDRLSDIKNDIGKKKQISQSDDSISEEEDEMIDDKEIHFAFRAAEACGLPPDEITPLECRHMPYIVPNVCIDIYCINFHTLLSITYLQKIPLSLERLNIIDSNNILQVLLLCYHILKIAKVFYENFFELNKNTNTNEILQTNIFSDIGNEFSALGKIEQDIKRQVLIVNIVNQPNRIVEDICIYNDKEKNNEGQEKGLMFLYNYMISLYNDKNINDTLDTVNIIPKNIIPSKPPERVELTIDNIIVQSRELANFMLELHLYLIIRNSLCIGWQKNVSKYINFEDSIHIANTINESENKRIINLLQKKKIVSYFGYVNVITQTIKPEIYPIAKKIFIFLQTYGFINMGLIKSIPSMDAYTTTTDNNNTVNKNEKNVLKPTKYTVAVIGAGISGLCVGRQLQNFGYNVTIFEGRNRVGGRIYTDTKTLSGPVDCGASIITGLKANPITILCRQIEGIYELPDIERQYTLMNKNLLQPISNHIYIYSSNIGRTNKHTLGGMIYNVVDKVSDFLRLEALCMYSPLPSTVYNFSLDNDSSDDDDTIAATNTINNISNKEYLSQYDIDINEEISSQYQCFIEKTTSIQQNIKHVVSMILQDRKISRTCLFDETQRETLCEEVFTRNTILNEKYINWKTKEKKLKNILNETKRVYKLCIKDTIHKKLQYYKNKDIYETPINFPYGGNTIVDKMSCDFSLSLEEVMEASYNIIGDLGENVTSIENGYYNWWLANIEYGSASPLKYISSTFWDDDSFVDWKGPHVMVRKGYGQQIQKLRKNLHIEQNKNVCKIESNFTINCDATSITSITENISKKIIITTSDGVKNIFDTCVITVPLGVLKNSKHIEFIPSLPNWKFNAINRLGFGILNKVILEFKKDFWTPHNKLINTTNNISMGYLHLNDTTVKRGQNFVFWNLTNCTNGIPILAGLLAGISANLLEIYTEEKIVQDAIQSLRNMFYNIYPTDMLLELITPIRYLITDWRNDIFSCGSYSFVRVNSTSFDYDLLAEPLCTSVLSTTALSTASTSSNTLRSSLRYTQAFRCANYNYQQQHYGQHDQHESSQQGQKEGDKKGQEKNERQNTYIKDNTQKLLAYIIKEIEKIPTIFFAGEATYRDNPATVPGAFCSGLRVAGCIHTSNIDRVNIYKLYNENHYKINKNLNIWQQSYLYNIEELITCKVNYINNIFKKQQEILSLPYIWNYNIDTIFKNIADRVLNVKKKLRIICSAKSCKGKNMSSSIKTIYQNSFNKDNMKNTFDNTRHERVCGIRYKCNKVKLYPDTDTISANNIESTAPHSSGKYKLILCKKKNITNTTIATNHKENNSIDTSTNKNKIKNCIQKYNSLSSSSVVNKPNIFNKISDSNKNFDKITKHSENIPKNAKIRKITSTTTMESSIDDTIDPTAFSIDTLLSYISKKKLYNKQKSISSNSDPKNQNKNKNNKIIDSTNSSILSDIILRGECKKKFITILKKHTKEDLENGKSYIEQKDGNTELKYIHILFTKRVQKAFSVCLNECIKNIQKYISSNKLSKYTKNINQISIKATTVIENEWKRQLKDRKEQYNKSSAKISYINKFYNWITNDKRIDKCLELLYKYIKKYFPDLDDLLLNSKHD